MGSQGPLSTVSIFTKKDPGLPRVNPTSSFWQLPAHALANVQSTLLPTSSDVVIIGSGITGCSIAKYLLENAPNLKITIVEARTLCSGATGRNGGHLTSSAPFEYLDLVSGFGREMALKIAKFTLLNIEKVYEAAKDIEESEVRLLQGVTSYFDEGVFQHSMASLKAFEADAPELAGKYTCLSASELEEQSGIRGACGGIVGPAGAMWPYRLVTRSYAELLLKYSGRLTIETSTPVTSISLSESEETSLYTCHTPRGIISARQVIHATNGHSGHLLPPIRGKIYSLRGTMTVQSSPAGFPNIGGSRSWSTHSMPSYDSATERCSLGLYYMTQNEKTGDIFLGGEDKRLNEILTSDDTESGNGFAVENLQTLPGKWFGTSVFDEEEKNARLKASWSGIMGFTGDGLPLIGKLSSGLTGRNGDGEWIAAGFNGYGMVNCWMCGVAVASMILGKEEEIKDWFPEAYRATQERLGKGMNVETAFQDFFQLKEM